MINNIKEKMTEVLQLVLLLEVYNVVLNIYANSLGNMKIKQNKTGGKHQGGVNKKNENIL